MEQNNGEDDQSEVRKSKIRAGFIHLDFLVPRPSPPSPPQSCASPSSGIDSCKQIIIANMSTSIQSTRPLAGLKQALRQCRAERQRCRRYATQLSQTSHEASSLPPPSSRPATKEQWAANPKSRRPGERSTQQSVDALDQATNIYPSLMPKSSALFKGPTKGFRPSQAIKQNRMSFSSSSSCLIISKLTHIQATTTACAPSPPSPHPDQPSKPAKTP